MLCASSPALLAHPQMWGCTGQEGVGRVSVLAWAPGRLLGWRPLRTAGPLLPLPLPLRAGGQLQAPSREPLATAVDQGGRQCEFEPCELCGSCGPEGGPGQLAPYHVLAICARATGQESLDGCPPACWSAQRQAGRAAAFGLRPAHSSPGGYPRGAVVTWCGARYHPVWAQAGSRPGPAQAQQCGHGAKLTPWPLDIQEARAPWMTWPGSGCSGPVSTHVGRADRSPVGVTALGRAQGDSPLVRPASTRPYPLRMAHLQGWKEPGKRIFPETGPTFGLSSAWDS